MQEVFSKIIEKLEDKRNIAEQLIMKNPYDELDRIQTQTAEDFVSAYNDAIEVVKQEVEKSEPYQPSGDNKKKTNFDRCCESMEAMAHIIDIAKIGWTKEQIMEWLQKEECEVPE